MLYRKCSHGHDIELYRKPYGMREIAGIVSRPSGRFLVVSHKKAVYQGNSFAEAEAQLIAECEKYHRPTEESHGRQLIGKHVIRDNNLVRIANDS